MIGPRAPSRDSRPYSPQKSCKTMRSDIPVQWTDPSKFSRRGKSLRLCPCDRRANYSWSSQHRCSLYHRQLMCEECVIFRYLALPGRGRCLVGLAPGSGRGLLRRGRGFTPSIMAVSAANVVLTGAPQGRRQHSRTTKENDQPWQDCLRPPAPQSPP